MIELLVTITLIPIVVLTFITMLYVVIYEGKRQAAQVELEEDVRLAISSVENDVRVSTSFETVIASPFSDPYGPDNAGAAWSFAGAGSSSRALILSGISTSTNSGSASRMPVYSDGPTYNCTTEMSLNPVLQYVTIIYLRDQTLYRRLLTDTTTTRCTPTIAQKQTCPGSLTGTWPTICKARDEVLARNVTSFSVDYYVERAATPTDVYSDPTPENMSLMDDALITLTLTGTGTGKDATTTQSLRIARLNKS